MKCKTWNTDDDTKKDRQKKNKQMRTNEHTKERRDWHQKKYEEIWRNSYRKNTIWGRRKNTGRDKQNGIKRVTSTVLLMFQNCGRGLFLWEEREGR